ncbi:TWiK family of potassium channels protein 12 [Harmonia axyridis]|uniref:TWiK family of potassium channels protein 12 n=1 Tax=Harmonia axyridis TaxID=115357 RepID=UPI001E277CD2|nr:TWiK family of potassium channels protein 12 [Harmonia axyridis]
MERGPYYRSSVRSRGSSNSRYSSNSDVDTKTKMKDCCRKTVAFMCSQVGVIGLIVGYTLIGALCFMKIELAGPDTNYYKGQALKKECSQKMWLVASFHNVFNKTAFVSDSNKVLEDYQKQLVILIKNNYTGRKLKSLWTFPAALMFSLSAITMIGYGDIAPKTVWGKICTVVYTVFGIPLYVLYFLNVGKGLAGVFKWIYVWFVRCSSPQDENQPSKRILVPSTACLWVISGYILFGTVMFAQWEKWSFLDSSYFCITSLCKLGFGDLVPGNLSSKTGSQLRLVMNYFYMFFGQGLVAMCYHLMSEEVRIKMKEMSEDFHQCLRDTQEKLNSCFRRKRTEESMYYL